MIVLVRAGEFACNMALPACQFLPSWLTDYLPSTVRVQHTLAEQTGGRDGGNKHVATSVPPAVV